MKYILFNRSIGKRQFKKDAYAVAAFLWGKRPDLWAVYLLQEHLPVETVELKKCLESREDRQFFDGVRDGVPLRDLPKWVAGQAAKKA